MTIVLAFDVYGTLIDTHGVAEKLRELVGDHAEAFSRTWRDKQLEYSFRRGLMRKYETFAVCTNHALDYTCDIYKSALTSVQKQELMATYRALPAFSDVNDALARLKEAGLELYAFSNGTKDAVKTLLLEADIDAYFKGIVSVDEVKTFKPNPDVYHHFLSKTGSGDSTWLISSNPFDVIGAISSGMRAVWIRRSNDAVFDPWGIEPTITVTSIGELHEMLVNK